MSIARCCRWASKRESIKHEGRMRVKKYRRAIALFLAIGLMVLIPSGMGVSASGNTVEAKMSENIAQVLSMTGIEKRRI